jgi:hypothetical protein
MLDQSFSAHNFETIYSLESRKGNIDVNTMPEEYRMVIARAEDIKKEIYSLRVKKDRSTKESELLEERKSVLNDLTNLKKAILTLILEKISILMVINSEVMELDLLYITFQHQDIT